MGHPAVLITCGVVAVLALVLGTLNWYRKYKNPTMHVAPGSIRAWYNALVIRFINREFTPQISDEPSEPDSANNFDVDVIDIIDRERLAYFVMFVLGTDYNKELEVLNRTLRPADMLEVQEIIRSACYVRSYHTGMLNMDQMLLLINEELINHRQFFAALVKYAGFIDHLWEKLTELDTTAPPCAYLTPELRSSLLALNAEYFPVEVNA